MGWNLSFGTPPFKKHKHLSRAYPSFHGDQKCRYSPWTGFQTIIEDLFLIPWSLPIIDVPLHLGVYHRTQVSFQ